MRPDQTTDARRAATLVLHHLRGDLDGVNQVLAELHTDDDPAAATDRLLFAVLGLLTPKTPTAQHALANLVLHLAAVEPDTGSAA